MRREIFFLSKCVCVCVCVFFWLGRVAPAVLGFFSNYYPFLQQRTTAASLSLPSSLSPSLSLSPSSPFPNAPPCKHPLALSCESSFRFLDSNRVRCKQNSSGKTKKKALKLFVCSVLYGDCKFPLLPRRPFSGASELFSLSHAGAKRT